MIQPDAYVITSEQFVHAGELSTELKNSITAASTTR